MQNWILKVLKKSNTQFLSKVRLVFLLLVLPFVSSEVTPKIKISVCLSIYPLATFWITWYFWAAIQNKFSENVQ